MTVRDKLEIGLKKDAEYRKKLVRDLAHDARGRGRRHG